MSRKSFAAVHTTRGRCVTSDHYLPLKLLRWYPTASSLLDSITVTLCYTERRPETWQVAGCSERTGQGSLWCTAVRQCHRTTTPSPLVAGASKDRLQLALLSYKTRSTGTPAYLASLLESYRPARELRSSNKNLLTVPHLSLALSAKAFCVSAPTVWNSLSDACREAELVSTFRSKLKTELFNVAYVAQLV